MPSGMDGIRLKKSQPSPAPVEHHFEVLKTELPSPELIPHLPEEEEDSVLPPFPVAIESKVTAPVKAKKKPSQKLKRITAGLAYTAIAAYACLLLIPFLPRLSAIGHYRTEASTKATPAAQALTRAAVPAPSATPEFVSGPNRLIVASMGIEGAVYEGATEATLEKGIWHRPGTSAPYKGGNTTLAAHRFKFTSGNDTFYNLDKVKVGDPIELIWGNIRYRYTVTESKTVTDRAVEIEGATDKAILTLYTCTPLWTSKDRLVVVAELQQ